MTVIACKDNIMAADSRTFSGDVSYAAGTPKIVRSPQGDIVGAAGGAVDCQLLRAWVEAGMDFSKPPEFRWGLRDDDKVSWLWLKPDGTLHHGGPDMRSYQVQQPYECGAVHACIFASGAMRAGASAYEAVRLTIEHCEYVGGPVQVEHLK